MLQAILPLLQPTIQSATPEQLTTQFPYFDMAHIANAYVHKHNMVYTHNAAIFTANNYWLNYLLKFTEEDIIRQRNSLKESLSTKDEVVKTDEEMLALPITTENAAVESAITEKKEVENEENVLTNTTENVEIESGIAVKEEFEEDEKVLTNTTENAEVESDVVVKEVVENEENILPNTTENAEVESDVVVKEEVENEENVLTNTTENAEVKSGIAVKEEVENEENVLTNTTENAEVESGIAVKEEVENEENVLINTSENVEVESDVLENEEVEEDEVEEENETEKENNNNDIPIKGLADIATNLALARKNIHAINNPSVTLVKSDVSKTPINEPYYTVDYFASQGIKPPVTIPNNDKLALQLKSFTEWLKTMKKINQTETVTNINTDKPQDAKVTVLAKTSLNDSDIVTETMADVLLKQGKITEAVETLKKLSLHDSTKSAYFATRIAEINKQL